MVSTVQSYKLLFFYCYNLFFALQGSLTINFHKPFLPSVWVGVGPVWPPETPTPPTTTTTFRPWGHRPSLHSPPSGKSGATLPHFNPLPMLLIRYIASDYFCVSYVISKNLKSLNFYLFIIIFIISRPDSNIFRI